MNASEKITPEQRENLVAYLDGELDDGPPEPLEPESIQESPQGPARGRVARVLVYREEARAEHRDHGQRDEERQRNRRGNGNGNVPEELAGLLLDKDDGDKDEDGRQRGG